MSRFRKNILVGFICFELILYISFLYIDLMQPWNYEFSSLLKFIGIVGCFLLTLIIYENTERKIYIHLMRGALLLTVISDIFLLLTDESEKGVFTFCIVQVIYRFYLWIIHKHELNKQSRFISLYVPNILLGFISLLILHISSMSINILLGITVFYFVSIIINVIVAIKTALVLRNPFCVIFAAGMVLFLLCDINVGIFNMGDFVLINNNFIKGIYKFSTVGMWLFYLPAQVLLVMSLFFMKKEKL